jgi:uncharacterized protein YbjQ (UPF0145 family)
MIITTTMEVPGRRVEKSLGIVTGNTIRAKHIGKDIVAGLRNIVGGELKEYTEMLAEARKEAIKRMEDEASRVGADAVIGVRLTTATVSHASAELLAYGTAVKLK